VVLSRNYHSRPTTNLRLKIVTDRPISFRLKEGFQREHTMTTIELDDDLAAALKAKADANI
jgi:hypothetical protein